MVASWRPRRQVVEGLSELEMKGVRILSRRTKQVKLQYLVRFIGRVGCQRIARGTGDPSLDFNHWQWALRSMQCVQVVGR